MRYLLHLVFALALAAMGCSETSGTGGTAGEVGAGGDGGVGGDVGAAGVGGEGGSAQNNPELEAFLDDYVYERMTDDDPGVAVALIGPGEVAEVAKSYGMADVEQAMPIDSHTIFDLASLSKQFTAASIMLLYEEGVVSPDDLVADAFPEGPPEWASMTVHHLLTHQSGLSDFRNDEIVGVSRGWHNDDVLEYLLETPLEFPPGDRYEYSNSGFVMLAILLERATGEPFEDFVREHIFEPLGMNDSQLSENTPPDVPNLAQAYILGAPYEYSAHVMGSTHQFSSLADMIKWELALRNGTLLSPDSAALMFTSHVVYAGDCGYGYGWVICNYADGVYQGHNGSDFAYRTLIEREPESDVTIIMLSNGSYNEWVYALGPALRDFYRTLPTSD